MDRGLGDEAHRDVAAVCGLERTARAVDQRLQFGASQVRVGGAATQDQALEEVGAVVGGKQEGQRADIRADGVDAAVAQLLDQADQEVAHGFGGDQIEAAFRAAKAGEVDSDHRA